MRIIAGQRKGKVLVAPLGMATRPTADRVRQAVFDMLVHAPWGGHDVLVGQRVLDAFAGTGALGLEALSRGASSCDFFETDRAALAALRTNIANCAMTAEQAHVYSRDVTGAPPARSGNACSLVFLDPPYRRDLVVKALKSLGRGGWIAPGAILVVETAADENLALDAEKLSQRRHGAAEVTVWRNWTVNG